MSNHTSTIKENGHQANYSSLPREEPEKIKKWREEQKLRLEKKGIEFIKVSMTKT